MPLQRRLLQIFLVLLALIVVVLGLLGMLGVDNPLYASVELPRSALLDTNMRFYSGLWLGLGIAVLATVRTLEKHFAIYCVLWGMIFVGGIGRLLSLLTLGLPPFPIPGFMLLEILGAPIFLYWHYRVIQSSVTAPS